MGTAASAKAATKSVTDTHAGAADALGAAGDDAAAEVPGALGAAGGAAAVQELAPADPAPSQPGSLEMIFEREDGTRVAKTFHAKPLGIEVGETKMPANISKVRPGSIAERSGVQAGWRLLAIIKDGAAEKPPTSWREVVLAAGALPQVRFLPLQAHAHLEEGSIAIVCTTLGGEEVCNLEDLGPDAVGYALAELIRESVPAPPSAQWKIVLPDGRCLENDDLALPLRELFGIDGAACVGSAAPAVEETRYADAASLPEPSILEMVFEREDGTRVVARPVSVELRGKPHLLGSGEILGAQAQWRLVEVNREDVAEKPAAFLRELLASAPAA